MYKIKFKTYNNKSNNKSYKSTSERFGKLATYHTKVELATTVLYYFTTWHRREDGGLCSLNNGEDQYLRLVSDLMVQCPEKGNNRIFLMVHHLNFTTSSFLVLYEKTSIYSS